MCIYCDLNHMSVCVKPLLSDLLFTGLLFSHMLFCAFLVWFFSCTLTKDCLKGERGKRKLSIHKGCNTSYSPSDLSFSC